MVTIRDKLKHLQKALRGSLRHRAGGRHHVVLPKDCIVGGSSLGTICKASGTRSQNPRLSKQPGGFISKGDCTPKSFNTTTSWLNRGRCTYLDDQRYLGLAWGIKHRETNSVGLVGECY